MSSNRQTQGPQKAVYIEYQGCLVGVRPYLHSDGTFSFTAWGNWLNGAFVFRFARASLDYAHSTANAAIEEGMRLCREAVDEELAPNSMLAEMRRICSSGNNTAAEPGSCVQRYVPVLADF